MVKKGIDFYSVTEINSEPERKVKFAKNKVIFRALSNPEVLGKRKEKELSSIVDIAIFHLSVLFSQFYLIL